MPASSSSSRARSRRRLVAIGGVLAAAFAAQHTASAPAAPVALVPATSGLAEPGALVRTPDGALWTTMPEKGVCRISPGAEPRPVTSAYCGDEDQAIGPKEALAMAFDAQSSSFFVADGGSGSGGVWRMHWNAATREIDGAVQITHLGDDRATGLALAPTGRMGAGGKRANDVYLTTEDSTAVLRIAGPQGAAAPPVTAGFARAAGAPSLAVLDDDLYIAESIEPEAPDLGGAPTPLVNGVSRLRIGGASAPQAVAVPGLDGGLANAVATDPVRGRVYMGTATGHLVDHVDVLDVDSGRVETYETGFTHVTALAVEADGDLLVGDDPAAGLLVVDADGMGRVWNVGHRTLDRPSPSITAAPPVVGNSTRASFAYTSRATAAFECRLDGAVFAPCPGTGSGGVDYEALAEGAHAFDVRAVDPTPGSSPGDALRRTFVIDLTAPSVRVDHVEPPHAAGGPARIEFSADEPGVAFTCSVDDRDPEPCSPGWVVRGLGPGTHQVRVEGVDLAGNASSPAEPGAVRRFTIAPPPPVPAAPAPPADTTAAPAPVSAATVTEPRSATTRRARGYATATVARRGAAPVIRVDFDVPAGARLARVSLRDFEEGPGARTLARTEVPLGTGSARLVWTLGRAEARRLRPGRYRVTVELRARRFGPAAVRTATVRIRTSA